MANYKRTATGLVSTLAEWQYWTGSAWAAALTLPSTGDVAYTNGFITTIDIAWTVLEIRNSVYQGTTASGYFQIISGGITFDGDRYTVGSYLLRAAYGSGESTILGRGYMAAGAANGSYTLLIEGAAGGILNLEHSGLPTVSTSYGAAVNGSAAGFIINVVDVDAGSNTYSRGFIVNGSNYVINQSGIGGGHYGNASGAHAMHILGSNNRIVHNGYGAAPTMPLGDSTYIFDSGLNNEIVVNGIAESTAFGIAIMQCRGTFANGVTPATYTGLTSWITLNGTLIGTQLWPAVLGKVRVQDGGNVSWLTKSPNNQNVSLYTASELTGYPLENIVKEDEVFGPSNEYTGTMPQAVLDAAAVATALKAELFADGTPWATPQDVAALIAASTQ